MTLLPMTTFVSIVADSREIKRARVTVCVNDSGTYDRESKGAAVASDLREELVLDMIKAIAAKKEVSTNAY